MAYPFCSLHTRERLVPFSLFMLTFSRFEDDADEGNELAIIDTVSTKKGNMELLRGGTLWMIVVTAMLKTSLMAVDSDKNVTGTIMIRLIKTMIMRKIFQPDT